MWHNMLMNTTLFARTGRLFATPSLTEGVGRVFDLFGTHDIYNEDLTPTEADSKALYSDWASVGDHLISAAKELAPNA